MLSQGPRVRKKPPTRARGPGATFRGDRPRPKRSMPMTAASDLRKQLQQGTVVAGGCFDALSARLVEHVGFKALHVTGFGVEATQVGAPDIGIITMTELASH